MAQEIGQATLFIQQANGKLNADTFREDDETILDLDPYHRAIGLWNSVKDDFPGAIHAIHVNDRGRELMADKRMKDMGLRA